MPRVVARPRALLRFRRGKRLSPRRSSSRAPTTRELVEGVNLINAGHPQAAIDGPLADIVTRLERQYANSPDQVYSPRGPALTADYSASATV